MEISIYGLVDTLTNEIRYVGKTQQSLNKRLSQHLCVKKKNNPYKFNWINKLKEKGIKPIIILLETCDEHNWVEREKYWIKQFNNLTNLTQGGENGVFFTKEILDKILIGVKKSWGDENFRKNHINKKIEYWSNPINRKKHSDKITGKIKPQSAKNILSKLKKKQWENNAYKEKMSEQSKNLWCDEKYKEKVLNYIKSDENKQNVSKRFKGVSLSDEHKQKISDSSKNKKPILIDNIKYNSITDAAIKTGLNRDLIKGRLRSKNYNNFTYYTSDVQNCNAD